MVKTDSRAVTLARYFILYMTLSFLGWLWETVYMYLLSGNFHDRGFLTLPFCPIYATVLLGIYFILGTVRERRGILCGVESDTARVLIYLCLAFLLPTVAELLVGMFFDKVLDIRLWDYSGMKYNTGGYVAIEISVLWGGAIFIFMNRLFLPIKNLIFKIPKKISCVVSLILVTAIAYDLIAILSKMFV